MLPQTQLLRRSFIVAAFALSCFGLLVLFWSAFGGTVPLRADGYQFTVDFDEATMLGVEAEVRRSGVPVGRVVALDRTPQGLTRATIQLDPDYVPARVDTRALLRLKSLAGETYVEVSAGRPGSPPVPDGGGIPKGNVEPSVQFDEVLSTFDARTRAAAEVWAQQQAIALTGRGRDLNDAVAQLYPLEEQATTLTRVLNANGAAVTSLVRGTGILSAAVSAREAALRGLIRSADRVFGTTARRDRQLAETFEALPAFERESRATLARLNAFGRSADPLVTQLRGITPELTPTLQATAALAPELSELAVGLGPLYAKAERGLPATTAFLADLAPFVKALPGTLAQLNPLLAYVGAYKADLASFVVNITAASQANSRGEVDAANRHYLRGVVMLGPEQLTSFEKRQSSSRNAPYSEPGQSLTYTTNQSSYETRQCDGTPWPLITDGPGLPVEYTSFLRERFGTTPIAPPCILAPLRGGKQFPQLVPGVTPTVP